jgi:hypothetical protein
VRKWNEGRYSLGMRPSRLLMNVMDASSHAKMLNGGSIEANHRIANNLALVAGLIRFQAATLPQKLSLPAHDVRGWLRQIS